MAQSQPGATAQLTPEEADELLGMEGPNGILAQMGAEHCIERIERETSPDGRVAAIASTDYVDLLEQLVGLMFDKIQPPRTVIGLS